MYEVIKRFRDKYTGQIYLPGDNFTSDEGERIVDLLRRNLIAVSNKVVKPSEKKKSVKKKSGD